MTTYYVDSENGNNQNDGLTEATAWQTVPRVNVADLQPGDSVAIQAGCSIISGMRIV